MGINTAIFDISGTTLKSDGSVQDGFHELISFLQEKNVKIAFTSNDNKQVRLLKESGLHYDLIVTPNEVNIKKPSPKYIEYILSKFKTKVYNCVYVGDNDRTDAYCASNMKVLYLTACWSNPNMKYGVRIGTPLTLKKFIDKFLLKDTYWGWEYVSKDTNGYNVKAYTLFDSFYSDKMRRISVQALKNNSDSHIRYLTNHMLASIYLSGMFHDMDTWCSYPSHLAGSSRNRTISGMIKIATQESKRNYLDLLIRHKESKDSGKTRHGGSQVDFVNQLSTVIVNPKFKKELKGKKILLLDDFITQGYSSECARNLLYEAGADLVVCLAFGKYGEYYRKIYIPEKFNPFQQVNCEDLVYYEKKTTGSFDKDSDKAILESLD